MGHGPASALLKFCGKFGTGMYHTSHVLERSMNLSEPLDEQNLVAAIYLGYHKTTLIERGKGEV
jgi:hypothetical protein